VTIEKVILGGLGLARLADGIIVLVPYVLPGEVAAIEIYSRKKQYAQARLVKIVEASSQRISPPCSYFASCGGCDLQHASYPHQLAVKADYFQDTLARALSPACFSAIQFGPVLGCEQAFNYRQRIRLQCDSSGRLGFYKKESHEIIDIDSCALAAAEINSVLLSLKEAGDRYSLLENAEAVELLYSPSDRKVIVVVHLLRKARPADIAAAKKLSAEIDLVKSVWIAVEGFALSGPYQAGINDSTEIANRIELSLDGAVYAEKLTFTIEPGGFCQVNLRQNQQLILLMLDWVREENIQGRALDLFCGMGNFSLPLAQSGFSVTGMDVQRAAIRSAQFNADRNNLKNCLFSRSDAQTAVEILLKNKAQFDLVLLDPPRQGCKNIISALPSLGAEYIIYISCDPATLARDLALLADSGYAIKRCRGVDMFPQTHHIESISLLQRSP
jgi:23S rRNA (uracil1939-C5)-methyltransferase